MGTYLRQFLPIDFIERDLLEPGNSPVPISGCTHVTPHDPFIFPVVPPHILTGDSCLPGIKGEEGVAWVQSLHPGPRVLP